MKLAEKILVNICENKELTGEVTKNRAPDLDFAFVKVPSMKDQIAVTPNTKLSGFRKIEDVKGKVAVTYRKTSRGPEATLVRPAGK